MKLTPADVRKANAARALKNQNRAKNNKKTKKGGQEKVRTFGKANPNAHKSKSVKENMIITCVYVHDDKVHSAESKALMSVYICEEEDWAMVVMNCHREKENGVKVYSERVTGVSLRWGSTYYHTQYDYFHSSHRGHRSWKIDSEKGKEETSKNTDSSTSNREGVGNRKSSKSTKRFSTMPAPISSQHSLSSSNSLNSFDNRSFDEENDDDGEEEKKTEFEQNFTGALLRGQHRRRRSKNQRPTNKHSMHNTSSFRKIQIHTNDTKGAARKTARKTPPPKRRTSANVNKRRSLQTLETPEEKEKYYEKRKKSNDKKVKSKPSKINKILRKESLLDQNEEKSDDSDDYSMSPTRPTKNRNSLPSERPDRLPLDAQQVKIRSQKKMNAKKRSKFKQSNQFNAGIKRQSVFEQLRVSIFGPVKHKKEEKDPHRHNHTHVLNRVSTHIDFLHKQVQRQAQIPSQNRGRSRGQNSLHRSESGEEEKAATNSAKRMSILLKDPRLESAASKTSSTFSGNLQDSTNRKDRSNTTTTNNGLRQRKPGKRRSHNRRSLNDLVNDNENGETSSKVKHKQEHEKQEIYSDLSNGQFVGQSEHETPWFVLQDPYNLIDRPPATSIYDEDLSLLSVLPHATFAKGLSSTNCFMKCLNTCLTKCFTNWGPKSFQFTTGKYRTGTARTALWQLWNRAQGDLEGVHAQLIDEKMLRSEQLLNEYWYERDHGRLQSARNVIKGDRHGKMRGQHMSDIVNACFVQTDVATRSRLWMRFSDLLVGGAGGQSIFVAANNDHDGTSQPGGSAYLRVMGLDSGTWPMDGGGVASCRRDVVNRIDGVRWEMVSETGNDMKTVHRSYQVEAHVQSLNFVPLWGLDLGSPSQNVLSHEPVLKLKLNAWRLGRSVIREYFLPLIRNLVLGCSMHHFQDTDIERFTLTFVNLHTFFQHYGWVNSWENGQTIRCWCDCWAEVYEEMRDNNGEKGKYDGNDQDFAILDAEIPTLEDMLVTLSLFTHFLLPITVPLNTHLNVPVTHASHHGIQTILGVIAKRKNGTALIIWDHGILWRERLRAFSNFRGFPLFARNVLVGLNRMIVQINFTNADVVVPCCRTNMDWELWIGSLRGNNYLRKKVSR